MQVFALMDCKLCIMHMDLSLNMLPAFLHYHKENFLVLCKDLYL